jgi:hypothetical protein
MVLRYYRSEQQGLCNARELERAFEELYDIIATAGESETD